MLPEHVSPASILSPNERNVNVYNKGDGACVIDEVKEKAVKDAKAAREKAAKEKAAKEKAAKEKADKEKADAEKDSAELIELADEKHAPKIDKRDDKKKEEDAK